MGSTPEHWAAGAAVQTGGQESATITNGGPTGGPTRAAIGHYGESADTKKPRKTNGFAGSVVVGSETLLIPTGLEPVLPP